MNKQSQAAKLTSQAVAGRYLL